MPLHKDMQHREWAGRIRSPCTVSETYDLTVTAEMWDGACWSAVMDSYKIFKEGQAKDVRKNMAGQGPEKLQS